MHRCPGVALFLVVIASCAPASSPSPGPSEAARSSRPPAIISLTPAAIDGTPTAIASATPRLPSGPAGTPNARPFAGGWPYIGEASEPTFGPDGTLYFLIGERVGQGELRQSLVAVDTAGNVKPGWPVAEPPGSDFGSPAVGPDGSIFLEDCGGPVVGCVLHQLGTDGREVPGWPFKQPADFACPGGGLCGGLLEAGPNGTVYLTHWRDVGGQQAIAIDSLGMLKPGWPVPPDGAGVWWSNAQLGSDGTLFLLGLPDGRDGPASIAAFGQDGRARPGWPVEVPARTDYLPGPDGTVVTWSLIDDVGELCSSPRRTVFTLLGPDGRILPGWPRGSAGYASDPVVGRDGTVYYVSALGNVYAHDQAGEVEAGWPVAVPGAIGWCNRLSPFLAPDGTIYVLVDDSVLGSELTARSPDGQTPPGWPYRPAGRLSWMSRFDTDGGPSFVRPAFGHDGTVYLVVLRADPAPSWLEVVAVDRRGQLKPGWPYRLPIDATTAIVESLTVSPDGRLFVRAGYSQQTLLLALDPDGRISE
jgi:outer membrane protein assembly factor BamB